MSSLKAKVCYAIRSIVQPIENSINNIKLNNSSFTIISSTCAGGIIYHRCKRKFLSPTVNLWFTEKDLQKMAANIHHYMEADLNFIKSEQYDYPVGLLDDIQIGFNHAKSNNEAREIWNRRRTRVDYDNIWLLSSDHSLTYEDIENFGKLPAKGRVMFTAKEYPEFPYCLCIKEYETEGRKDVGVYMSDHTPVMDHFVWEKYFDYVRWLNTGKVK